MSASIYVSPEQLVKDRAEFARAGIAKGRSVVVGSCAEGVLLVADNPSRTLRKISEIYDRIAFAAVGKYHEFESLRVAGVQYADTRGYAYARTDVTARALANAYAQSLGMAFTQGSKPLEVEVAVAEVGESPAADQLYRLQFDGSVGDEQPFIAMGGGSEALAARLAEVWHVELTLNEALRAATRALGGGTDRPAGRTAGLEVALLQRHGPRRAFRRLTDTELRAHLGAAPEAEGQP